MEKERNCWIFSVTDTNTHTPSRMHSKTYLDGVKNQEKWRVSSAVSFKPEVHAWGGV